MKPNSSDEIKNSIIVTLPDGKTMELTGTTTGYDVAKSISDSLAKSAIAVKLDGKLYDLNRIIENDAKLEIITKKSKEAAEIIRHTCSHVMAEAVQELFPGTQVTIGPSIEDGFYYDFSNRVGFTPDDLPKIEKKMEEIIKRNESIVREVWTRHDAIKHFKALGEKYKVELIEALPEDDAITVYRQGKWLDLCRGPHLPSTGQIGNAFKLMKVAGAYWRGDAKNEMLHRIYGTAWAEKKDLEAYLTMLEEAEKRDHRKIGKEMDLFHFQEEAPGQVFWHHNGWTVYNELMAYMRYKLNKYDYTEVNTPQMLDSKFWKASGHWDKYKENMFIIKSDDEKQENPMALKPMSCPGHAQLYNQGTKSYRDLPIRMAEFGKVFRQESSGSRHGLMRVQCFSQDDAHIFCTDDQLEDEVIKMCDLIKEVYTDLGLAENILINFSTRPEQRIGSDKDWDRAEAALQKVLDRIGMKWKLNPGDGAFYAPKLDFVVTDAIGREWQCGTIQVDMNMPNRLSMHFIGEDGEKKTPHMIHRAIMGSIERFMGVLIEHCSGRFPMWLAPVQVVVTNITSDTDNYAEEILVKLKELGIRAQIDLRNEKINYKIREHSVKKVPEIWVVGNREAESKSVAIRRLGSENQEVLALDVAISKIVKESSHPK